MPSPIPFHEFKRIFKRHGIETIKTGGPHPWALRGELDGVPKLYKFPVHKNEVKHVYLGKAWRAFQIPGEPGK